MKRKKMFKKITRTTLAITLVASAIIPFSNFSKDVYAKDVLINQGEVIQNATGTITPVENEFVGNAKKKIFSSAHFKVACTGAFAEIHLNGQKLSLSPSKWSDINLSNVKKLLNEGENNKIEIFFENDRGDLYVGGNYEFIYDVTPPVLTLKNTSPDKVVVELGSKYSEEYTVSDNYSDAKNVNVDMIYYYNNNGSYEIVDSMNKVGNYTVWYNISDEAGNIVEKAATREVDVIDTTGPKVYPSKSVGSEVEGVIYHSYVDLKLNDIGSLSHLIVNEVNRLNRSGIWNDANYINLKGYYRNNQLNTVEVFDIYGNSSTYTFVYDIDKPVLDIQYSKLSPTNQPITVTIKATNELYDGYGGIQEIEGWTKIDNQTYQKTFEENTSIVDLPIIDFAGNVSYVNIEVNNIDKKFEKTTLTYSVAKGDYTNGNVDVTLKCDEDILNPEGWSKNVDGTYTKTFSENGNYEFELQDLAGNKKTIVVVIDQIDRVAPVINGVESNKYYNDDVSYTIDEEHLDYVMINNVKYTENIPTTISAESKYIIVVVDKAGNETSVTFEIDKTIPEVVDIQQKYESKENGRIKVNITFSEPVKLKNTTLWKAVNGDKAGYAQEYYGYFYQTENITLNFADRAGNLGTNIFTVDMTAPSAQISYTPTAPTRDNVVATLVVNEDVNEAALNELGWLKLSDKIYTKEYEQNIEETFTIYDLVGNPGEVMVKITNIDRKGPEYKPDKWYFTIEVDSSAPNPYLTSEQVSEILDAQKQFITDENAVTVVEDTWWNHNSSTLDIRKVGNYTNAFSFYIADAAGNRINPRITVKVIDTTAPIIDLGDVADITSHEAGTPFVDITPTATDNSGETIAVILNKVVYATSQTELETSTEYLDTIDVSRLGWYKLEYKAEDSSGNVAYASRIVNVIDTTAPEYTIAYSPTGPTYDTVKVTITTNEVSTIVGEDWQVDETGMIFTKVYSSNTSEDVRITDAFGNDVVVSVKVENIVNIYWLDRFVNQVSSLDADKYTKVTWDVYYPVYEKAVAMLDTPHSQVQVDKMYEELVRAYLNLRLKPTDITAPEYVVEYSTTELTYDVVTVTITTNEVATITGEGWQVDETGMVFTKVFTANANEEVVLTDKAGNAATASVSVENIVNKDLLEELVRNYSDLDAMAYTEESWNAYYPVYQEAIAMLETPHSQALVDQMYEDLLTAYSNLQLKPEDITPPQYTIDYSITEVTYDKVKVTITTNEVATITGEGWQADETGMVFTKVFTVNTDEEVVLTDEAGNAATASVSVKNIVDKGLLDSFVTKYGNLDASKYTELTWNAYDAVYQEAVAMLEIPHNQAEVDQMYKDLVRAYLGLRLNPDAGLIDDLNN